jgi:hypothetical protein
LTCRSSPGFTGMITPNEEKLIPSKHTRNIKDFFILIKRFDLRINI